MVTYYVKKRNGVQPIGSKHFNKKVFFNAHTGERDRLGLPGIAWYYGEENRCNEMLKNRQEWDAVPGKSMYYTRNWNAYHLPFSRADNKMFSFFPFIRELNYLTLLPQSDKMNSTSSNSF